DTEHEALTAHVCDEARIEAEDERTELRTAPRRIRHEPRPLDLGKDRIADRGRERVATEGTAVLPWLHELSCVTECDERANRHASANALRKRDRIRDDAGLLE